MPAGLRPVTVPLFGKVRDRAISSEKVAGTAGKLGSLALSESCRAPAIGCEKKAEPVSPA
jgi:hypothetical protein